MWVTNHISKSWELILQVSHLRQNMFQFQSTKPKLHDWDFLYMDWVFSQPGEPQTHEGFSP